MLTTGIDLPAAMIDDNGRHDPAQFAKLLALTITGKPISDAEADAIAASWPAPGPDTGEPIMVPE